MQWSSLSLYRHKCGMISKIHPPALSMFHQQHDTISSIFYCKRSIKEISCVKIANHIMMVENLTNRVREKLNEIGTQYLQSILFRGRRKNSWKKFYAVTSYIKCFFCFFSSICMNMDVFECLLGQACVNISFGNWSWWSKYGSQALIITPRKLYSSWFQALYMEMTMLYSVTYGPWLLKYKNILCKDKSYWSSAALPHYILQ